MPLRAKRAESLKLHCGKVNNTSWCLQVNNTTLELSSGRKENKAVVKTQA